jgi:hypothetical protein
VRPHSWADEEEKFDWSRYTFSITAWPSDRKVPGVRRVGDERLWAVLSNLTPDDWLLDHLRGNVERGKAEQVAEAADALASVESERGALRERLRGRLRDSDHLIALTAADRLLRLGDRGQPVMDVLRARLQSPADKFFWAAADVCAGNEVREDWVRQALLGKLQAKEGKQENPLAGDEALLAAVLLIQLKVRDEALVNWVLDQLYYSEAAKAAAEDLGEIGFGHPREIEALRQLLNNEDVDLAGAAAGSLVKLRAHDEAARGALLKVIEKSEDGRSIARAVEALHSLGPLDRQALALVHKRFDPTAGAIPDTLAATLVKLGINDDTTLELWRARLDTWALYRPSVAKYYAELALLKPSQSFDENLDRLSQELVSPAADASRGYRLAVQAALVKLAEQQFDKPAKEKNLKALRERLSPLLSAAEMHRQIAAYDTLEGIDELPKKRWFSPYESRQEN